MSQLQNVCKGRSIGLRFHLDILVSVNEERATPSEN